MNIVSLKFIAAHDVSNKSLHKNSVVEQFMGHVRNGMVLVLVFRQQDSTLRNCYRLCTDISKLSMNFQISTCDHRVA